MWLTQPQSGASVHSGDWTLTQALAKRGDLGSNYHEILRLRRFTTRQITPIYPTTSRALSAQRERNTLTLWSSCHLRWKTDWRIFNQETPRLGRPCTMHGRKTLPLSTSSLHRILWWVRISMQLSYLFSSWKSWKEASRWDPLSLSLPLADSLVSFLASALSPS